MRLADHAYPGVTIALPRLGCARHWEALGAGLPREPWPAVAMVRPCRCWFSLAGELTERGRPKRLMVGWLQLLDELKHSLEQTGSASTARAQRKENPTTTRASRAGPWVAANNRYDQSAA